MARLSPLMIAPPVVFLAFVVLAATGMMRGGDKVPPSARIGQMAPELSLEALPGKQVFLEEVLRDGEVKLVNFWASWCAPCRVEHPNLEVLAQQGVAIYGVNYRDDSAKALAFLNELGDPYRAVGADPNARTGLDWGLFGVPETFLIAGDGTVLLRHAGPVTQRVLADRLGPAIEDAFNRE